MNLPLTVVISQSRDSLPEERKLEQALIAGIRQRGLEPLLVPHLYDLAPLGADIESLRDRPGDLLLFGWLYARAAYWVLDANRITGRLSATSFCDEDAIDPAVPSPARRAVGVRERTLWCIDLRSSQHEAPYLAELERILAERGEPSHLPERPEQPSLAPAPAVPPRWYPVIDYARCTNCLECLNFCLFGVFDLDAADTIDVALPDACRNGCPACARICPAGAIVFPQHKSPGIAGDPHASAEGLQLDLSQIFGGTTADELAAAERARAVGEQRRAVSSEPDALDHLVNGVDEMDA